MTHINIILKENDPSSGGIPRLRNINVHSKKYEIDLTFVDGTDMDYIRRYFDKPDAWKISEKSFADPRIRLQLPTKDTNKFDKMYQKLVAYLHESEVISRLAATKLLAEGLLKEANAKIQC